MKSHLSHCATVAFCILSLAGPATAAEGGQMKAFLTELGVNPAQMSRIESVHTQAEPQLQAAREALKAARAALRQQVATADATDAQLQALFGQVSAAAQALHKLHFDNLLKVRSILTPAQREQAAQLLQQKRRALQRLPYEEEGSELP